MGNKKPSYTGVGLALGAAMGAGLGLVFLNNVWILAGVGTIAGLLIGAVIHHNRKQA